MAEDIYKVNRLLMNFSQKRRNTQIIDEKHYNMGIYFNLFYLKNTKVNSIKKFGQ